MPNNISAEDALAVLREAQLLHDAATVEAAVQRMAADITTLLSERRPIVLCVMIGGLIPAGWLLSQLDFPLEVDYCHATRYRGATSGGDLKWLVHPAINQTGRDVLIIDDILDEGHTLAQIIDACRAQGANAVYTATLLNKRHDRRLQGLQADFIGLEVGDRYVFGAGMDYKGWFRNLPEIYAVAEPV